ncbi:MAG: hypothetical protein ACI33P_09070 [Lysinibacillus sp.]
MGSIVAVVLMMVSFAGLGAMFRSGRGLLLLAEDGVRETDAVALSRFAGNVLLALSGAASMWLLYLLTDKAWTLYMGSGLFLGLTVLSLFYEFKWKKVFR